MKHLKLFSTDAAYQTFKDSEDFVLPNVSYTVDNKKTSYNPYVEAKETRLVCTYNVTDTTNSTKLCENTSSFTSMEVDGILLDSITPGYTFETAGKHTVKFELTDPTSTGVYAFYNCSGLTSIVIPDSVTSIGDCAFSGCSGLTSIVIPDSVTSIDSGAFGGCSGLTSIVIPDSVTSIGEGVFGYCSGLTSINIPDSVTSIDRYAFQSCTGLTSINIPDSVTSIGNGAFQSCTGLKEITCNAITAPTIGGDFAFYGVKKGGVLKVPAGSDYSSWMSTGDYYLGKYNWTIEYI